MSERVTELLGQLTLAEKCAMVGGQSSWTVAGCARLGIPDWAVSDGPVGVRGRLAGPGLVVPGPSALAATWDPDIVAQVGAALGQECVDKHVDLLLAPTVNLHRSPRGGRHFECFSEDPELSSRTAVAYITGVQSTGIGACVKHFVANDQETERFTIDVVVDERTLREIYFPPFEAAVREAGVRSVMGAYNGVNGHPSCANGDLLEGVLREEWGFGGFVISDWFAISETVAPAANGLDLEMPGPGKWWGNGRLEAAVERGDVDRRVLDDKVRRLLDFLDWRGRLGTPTDHTEAPAERPEHRALARRAATESIVLLRNDAGLLPLAPGRTVAVIGPGAAETSLLGGGSSALLPYRESNVLDAVTARLGAGAITSALGVRLRRRALSVPDAWLPVGVTLELFAGDSLDGEPVSVLHRDSVFNVLHGAGAEWPAGAPVIAVRMRATVVPDASGRFRAMAAGIHHARLFIDGELVADNETDPLVAGLGQLAAVAEIELEAGRSYEFVLEHRPNPGWPVAVVNIGLEHLAATDDELLDEAVRVAAAADIAVVVVGTSHEWESEGADRERLDLPADQDELVRRVSAANPNTVVVLNCGAPVTMPWLDDVAAAMLAWYPGQEGGDAIADVLVGDADPGGRMPTTWAMREEDTPAYLNFPGEAGEVRYGEGIYVGYRWYDARRIDPLVPFGHGGSYATFEWGEPSVSADGTELEVTVPVTNASDRPGTEVVQVYVAVDDPVVHRPRKELAGFVKVRVDPGDTVTATVPLRERALARWDVATHAWVVDPGRYRLLIAASAVDIRSEIAVTR